MENVRRLPVEGADEGRVGLDELAREGARRMIAVALEAEVDEYVSTFVDEVDEHGTGWWCATAARASAS